MPRPQDIGIVVNQSCSWSDNAGWVNEARKSDDSMNILSNKLPIFVMVFHLQLG